MKLHPCLILKLQSGETIGFQADPPNGIRIKSPGGCILIDDDSVKEVLNFISKHYLQNLPVGIS